jgi:steroid delta-isomerase-like uncharacterized protein
MLGSIGWRGAVGAALALALLAVPAQAGPRETVAGYMAAWNAHDAAKAAAFMAEGVTYLDATVGEPLTGRDAAREGVIELFMTAVPDLTWEMKGEPVVGEGAIAFEWRFSGTNTGPWSAETPATGKSFAFDGVTLMRLDGDAILYQADYYDALGFQKQLGWIE